MNIGQSIDEGRRIVECLMGRQSTPFVRPTMQEIPDDAGIYAFSDRRTEQIVYVGQSKKGLRGRVRDHWDGITPSDLAGKLVKLKIARDVRQGRSWIKDNIVIRWLTTDEFEMNIDFAEHFVIGTLRPPFNG